MFASTRRLPSSMLTSLTSAYSRICFTARRYASASAEPRMSGSLTISTSGTPARLRSTAVTPGNRSWTDLPASSSMCTRVTPIAMRRAVVLHSDLDAAAGRERPIELRDLVSLRQVGIEVVLSREDRRRVHLAAERERGANRQLDGVFVEHRQRAGQRRGTPDTCSRSAARRSPSSSSRRSSSPS